MRKLIKKDIRKKGNLAERTSGKNKQRRWRKEFFKGRQVRTSKKKTIEKSEIAKKALRSADAEDMQTAYALIGIGGERLIEGVVTVRRYERLPARKAAHHGCVIKIPRRSPELHQIPDFEFSQRHFFRKRTRAFVVHEKAIEIFDARPRRRSVVGADIIPP